MEKKKRWKITLNAPVTLGFTGLCFITMILNYVTGGLSNRLLFMTYHSSLMSGFTYIRFFTHVLGHSGWQHYIGNMSYILLLGPLLEEKYGSKQMAEVICVTAFVTGMINYILFWNVALCGASGVVFAFILLASFTNFKEGELPLTVILVSVIFIGEQVYEGIFIQDNISNMAHILGGLVGTITGYVLNKKKQ